MSRLIDAGMSQLSKLLQKMADLAQETVSLSLNCYIEGTNAYEKVRSSSQTLVALSEEIDEKAVELIARYQPVASDLRTIKSYIKIAYDLARYGRYAWDIAFICEKLNVNWKNCKYSWLPLEEMTRKVLEIIKMSIEAIKTKNLELTKEIGEVEKEVDSIYYKCLDKMMKEAPTTTKCIIFNILFLRHLERLADHAAYIAKSIVYLKQVKK